MKFAVREWPVISSTELALGYPRPGACKGPFAAQGDTPRAAQREQRAAGDDRADVGGADLRVELDQVVCA